MSIATRSRRLAGLGLAATLVAAGSVALAPASQAADSYTLSPKTGPGAAAGAIVTVTGKKFKSAAGSNLVGTVDFQAAACGSSASGTTVTTKSVISATKMTITVPSLALGTSPAASPKGYFLCVYTSASGNALMGSAKYTVYAVPTIANSGLSVAAGSTLGGTEVGITGTGFTKDAKVTFDGVAASKVTFGDATSLLAVAPPHAAGTSLQVRVVTEGGTSPNNGTHDDFSYLDTIKVSPAAGNGTTGDVLEVTGVGFNARTFGTAVGNSTIAVVAAGTSLAAAATVPTTQLCGTVQVENDKTLSCQLGTLTDGAYTVVIITRDATTNTNIGSATSIARSATYTVSDF